MAKQKLTIFQKLGRVLKDEASNPLYNIDPNSFNNLAPDELKKKELEAQQTIYLQNQWKKIDSELYQKAVYYEPTRMASYFDYEAMEYTPEISVALDIFADEATTSNEHGQILNIYSESNRIKQELTHLFENVLDINTNLTSWARNLCKYGDNFVYNKIIPNEGIVGCMQLPNIEITRTEPGFTQVRTFDDFQDERVTKFHWKDKNITFNSFEISHFRLLFDDRKLPYGTSLLEKVRRIWKQLLLAEDAMLVYRTTRAPERRVYKIFVGNMDDKDVDAYVDKIANNFKRVNTINNENGQQDTRYNAMPVWYKTPIPLLDGRTITIEELSKEYEEGKENWVYSIQDETHNIVPGKVKWCGKNYTAEKLVKVWLDDDTWIMTAPEHPFIMRNGEKKRADELQPNDSLMPFYRKYTTFSNYRKNTYEEIFNIGNNKYEYTHRVIANSSILKESEKFNTIHHINFNRYDNRPNNLMWVEFDKHIEMHGALVKDNWKKGIYRNNKNHLIKYNKSEKKREQNKRLAKEQNWGERFVEYNHSDLHKEHDKIRKTAQLKDWSNPNKKEYRSKQMRVSIPENVFISINKAILNKQITKRDDIIDFINNNHIDDILQVNSNKRLQKLRKVSRTIVERSLNEMGFSGFTEYINNALKNHKVKHIEILENQNEDVYCMTVVGQNGEEDRHNFAVKSFKNDGEISVSGCVLGNSVDQDYFIPVRDPSLNMPIETLPGACISLDTRIPLLDGRTLELSEIINEWDNGNRNLWVYSCDPKTGAVAPGMITWAGITRKNADVIKITLDNGKEIITTPDHNFVHRTKGFVEAQNLVVGDSLMPFYRKEDYILNKKYAKKYKEIWDNEKQEWIFVHRMVNNFQKENNIEEYFSFNIALNEKNMRTIHHKDNNRYNNNPSNLVLMDSKDHYKYHRYELWGTPEKCEKTKEKISKGVKKYLNSLNEEEQIKRYERINNPISKAKTTKKLLEWNKDKNNLKLKGKKISLAYTDERKNQQVKRNIENWKKQEFKDKIFTKKQTITFTNELYDIFVKEFEKTLRADITLNTLNNNESFMEIFRSNNKDIRSSLTNLNKFTQNHIEKMVKQRGFKNFTEWKKNECKERGYINIRQWKYNVDKNKLYNHKIAKIEWLNDKIDTGTITVDGDELYHNYHTFAIENEIFIKNSNLSEIEDIEYIQKKLLAALRVPKAFLGFDEATGEGKNLAILDIRFARAVHRVQKALIQELNKMAIIHLYLKGFEDELNNFTLSLTTPSTQADLLKIQNWKEKVQLYKEAVSDAGNGFAAMSMTRAQKEFLGMSEDEIKLDIQRQVIEKAANEEFLMLGGVIKQTGIFRDIYKLYDINPDNMEANADQGGEEGGEAPMGGGGFDTGGFEAGGEGLDTGGGDIGMNGEEGGGEGGGVPGAVPVGSEENLATDFTPDLKLDDEENNLTESKIIQKNKYDSIVNSKSNKLTKAMLKIIEEIDQNTK